MGAFVQWIACGYEEIRGAFAKRVSDLRLEALRNPTHARTPGIVANLQAAFEFFLEFCVESEALDRGERDRLGSECWVALDQAAGEKAKHQSATEPAARFLELLRACLSSGRAHLQPRQGPIPDRSAGACGWRLVSNCNWTPLGDCIGWVEGDEIFLESTAAYRVAQIAGREMGEQLAITEQTLKKRLHEKGLLASTDIKRETLTVRRSIAGSLKPILHFWRSTILPEAPDNDQEDA